jgi:two-component system chemotaxis response regulator CheY
MIDPATCALVIEGSLPARNALRNCLLRLGLGEVLEASNGEQAWSVLMTEGARVGVILSDWSMSSSRAALDLLRWMRADERLAHIPFVIVTNDADRDNVMTAIQEGVSGYVLRPLAQETLQRSLERVLSLQNEKRPALAAVDEALPAPDDGATSSH